MSGLKAKVIDPVEYARLRERLSALAAACLSHEEVKLAFRNGFDWVLEARLFF